MAAIDELDASLKALLHLKPPGVTKGRIQTITQLCIENIQSESVIIQKIFAHFKRTPGTHKLGVLYAVDSVARQWIEKAGGAGHTLKSTDAPAGTFAAGVIRITEMLPTMMSELIAQAPEEHLDKINKLVDIWDRGSTFPAPLLADFKSRIMNKPKKQPSPELEKPANTTPPASTAANGTAPPAQVDTQPLAQIPPYPQTNGHAATAQDVNPSASLLPAPSSEASAEQLGALASILPQSAMTDPQKMSKYLSVLQQLVDMKVEPTRWGGVIQALEQQEAANAQNASQAGPQNQQDVPAPAPAAAQMMGRPSPPRDRSRSPVRRGSPVYDSYRERSPMRSPDALPQTDRPKWVEYDNTLPPNHIKVLSRTLFVGGTTCPERDLREVFGHFGNVQSVICQPQKRHAFVKMFTREESLRAKTGMDATNDQNLLSRARSTKWGVGFGPRECCNYDTGVSVIPIDRLTDADRRWILSAEYGGNGGQDITSGQVIEEPDIEIGAGVSSKAISLKVGQQQQQTQQQSRGRQQHQNRRQNNRGQDHRNQNGMQQRGPAPMYQPNPNPYPPYQPEQPMMPPAMPPAMPDPHMAMGFPPPMQFGFPPQGGFQGFPPPGMPHFPMQ